MASNPWDPWNRVEVQCWVPCFRIPRSQSSKDVEIRCLEACIEIPRSRGLKVVFLKFLRALQLQSHDAAVQQVLVEQEGYDTVAQILAEREGWKA